MTRFLSEALQAPEPFFRMHLQRLETANGHPNNDIRMSTEVSQATQAQIQALGLDPCDTTPQELYSALQERIKSDDIRLTRTLRTRAAQHVSAEADVVAGMMHALEALPDSRRCFGLKASSFKALIKKAPPKKAMKQLGYRSLESFLKHEPAALVMAAGQLAESPQWQRKITEQYKKLHPNDFETRQIALVRPESKRWKDFATHAVNSQRHNLISFKELGVIVFLPLTEQAPAGTTTISLALALHELNQIRAASTFLKLCQVRRDFGTILQSVVADEPKLSSQLLDKPVPWHLIQRFYARLEGSDHEQVFEPHLEVADMAWHEVERAISAIEPCFAFWHDAAHLALQAQPRTVSLNLIDTALNYCNQLPFERSISQFFQQSLWYELLLRYLRPEAVEKTVMAELQPQLAAETVLA